jgi:hypothetical protein
MVARSVCIAIAFSGFTIFFFGGKYGDQYNIPEKKAACQQAVAPAPETFPSPVAKNLSKR